MVGKGLLERLERGKYRVRSAGEYARAENDVSSGYELLSTATMTYALTGVDGVFVWTRGGYNASGYELLSTATMTYALTGVDGVFVWTRGGYNAGRFFGFYPIHLKVFARDLPRWRSFFHKAGKNAFIAERKPERTLFGVFYLLYPSTRIKAETVNMLRVEPLTKTLQFCRNNIYTFEPALEMLTQQYRNSTKAAA